MLYACYPATFPVSGLLLQKSILYPSFLLLFSLLCLTCCFSLWRCLKCHLFISILLCYVLMPVVIIFFSFPPHHGHCDCSLYCRCNFPISSFFSGLPFFLSASLCFLLSFPSWTLFYMFCRGICGSFFLFALFHFLFRAVVQSAEVRSPPRRGPALHVEAVDNCLRPLRPPALM